MSNKKRKDKTGAVFRTNEGQLKTGRYYFRYTNERGKKTTLYGKTLKELREKENELNFNIQNGVDIQAGMMTVSELLDLYMELHADGARPSTVKQYRKNIITIKKTSLGKVKIKDVTVLTGKKWVKDMNEGRNPQHIQYSVGSLRNYVSLLNRAFNEAYEANMVLKNPFTFSVRKLLPKERVKSKIIPEEDYRALIEFLVNDKRYYDIALALILAHETGLRIGEICGLTVDDIDFENGILSVNKQVILGADNTLYVGPPKSDAGHREVPLSNEAIKVAKILVDNVKTRKNNPCLDGVVGFLFITSKGTASNSGLMGSRLANALRKYRKNVDPNFPHFTFHSLRHMFADSLNQGGVNPKNTQYIMGHSNVDITVNTYMHTNREKAISDYRDKIG